MINNNLREDNKTVSHFLCTLIRVFTVDQKRMYIQIWNKKF